MTGFTQIFVHCRVCHKHENVVSWPSDKPSNAICPPCCAKTEHPDGESGHQFYYEGPNEFLCTYCGDNAECSEEGQDFLRSRAEID